MKVLKMVLPRFSVFARNIASSAVRRSEGGVPGENLPFDTKNRYKLTALFIVFFGSGLAVPFYNVQWGLTRD